MSKYKDYEDYSNFKYLINITRERLGQTCVIGELEVIDNSEGLNTIFKCFTLEEEIESDEKGKDHRVPEGQYKVFWHENSRFKDSISRIVGRVQEPLGIYNDKVPKTRYILIHQGNTHKDTEGCILLGLGVSSDGESITQSRDAIKGFYLALNRCNSRKIGLIIKNEIK